MIATAWVPEVWAPAQHAGSLQPQRLEVLQSVAALARLPLIHHEVVLHDHLTRTGAAHDVQSVGCVPVPRVPVGGATGRGSGTLRFAFVGCLPHRNLKVQRFSFLNNQLARSTV